MKIPATPNELTPEFLTAVLRESGTIRKQSIKSVQMDVVAAGRGFAAQSAHLTLTYDADGHSAPATMFAKLSSANPDVRERLRLMGLYETEVGFYRDLSPACPLSTPAAFASLYEDRSGESLLLLEEIGHLRFGDNLAGSTLEEARMVIDNLARLHACYWNHPQLKQCGWLRSAAHDLAVVPGLYRSVLPVFKSRWALIAPAGLLDATTFLNQHIETWLESHMVGPRTLAHGDARPDNFAFDSSGKMLVFDWQTARFDPGSRDVAYFLAFSMPVESRRAHEAALLERYHQTLLSHGVQGYTFDEVMANHRRSLGSAVLRLVTAGALLDFTSERARRLAETLFQRVAAAVEDHEFGIARAHTPN